MILQGGGVGQARFREDSEEGDGAPPGLVKGHFMKKVVFQTVLMAK